MTATETEESNAGKGKRSMAAEEPQTKIAKGGCKGEGRRPAAAERATQHGGDGDTALPAGGLEGFYTKGVNSHVKGLLHH